jgi:hypothetical protein
MIEQSQSAAGRATTNALLAGQILEGTTFDPEVFMPSAPDPSDAGRQGSEAARSGAVTFGEGVTRFRGRLEVAGMLSPWPETDFSVVHSAEENLLKFESELPPPWPRVTVILELDAERRAVSVKTPLEPADRTVDAEIFYTRFVYALMGDGRMFLHDLDHGRVLKLRIRTEGEDEGWLHLRSKQARKLKFIEEAFDVRFRLPEDSTWSHARSIEMIFRCLTEARFNTRHQVFGVAGYAPTADELGRPPFAGSGEFDCDLTAELAVYDQSLDITPAAVHLGCAEVLDLDKLKGIVEAGRRPAAVNFVVLDQQVRYRFPEYEPRVGHFRARLDELRRRLLAEEPAELAGLLDAPLAKPVTEDEARQIVIGWLQHNQFPDGYWPNVARLEGVGWRVPVWIAYPSGEGAPVEDAFVDLLTGEMSLPLSAEEMRARGKAVAAELSRDG